MVLNKVKKSEENSINFLSDNEIKKYLKWPLVYEAIELALLSVVFSDDPNNNDNNSNNNNNSNHNNNGNNNNNDDDENHQMKMPSIILHLPKKTKTMTSNFGFLHTLSAYIGNYHLPLLSSITGNKKPLNTLACKLITCFNENENNSNNNNNQSPLPNIMGNILLFNSNTGQVEQILEATEITAWRTAATSLVATKHLYFNRIRMINNNAKFFTTNLAIIGCSVQGRIHAIAMCTMFNIDEVHLWNRSILKAKHLQKELDTMKMNFKNTNVKITIWKTIAECIPNADIIVTATFSNECLIKSHLIVKDTVHINAIGAGKASHLCEIDRKIYEKSKIYVDSVAEASDDFKKVDISINGGEIGQLIRNINAGNLLQSTGFTIFQPFGIAVEDAVVAQSVYEQYKCDKIK